MTSPSSSAGPAPTPRPVSVADLIAINRLMNRYSDAVVHRNGVQWASCWADSAVWDLGGGRLVEGKEAIVKLWYAAMGGMTAVVQHVHNGDAWYEGGSLDRAFGRWAISERFLTANGARGVLLAEYHDGFVQENGQWLFARRLLKPHYQGPADLSGDFRNSGDGLRAGGEFPDV